MPQVVGYIAASAATSYATAAGLSAVQVALIGAVASYAASEITSGLMGTQDDNLVATGALTNKASNNAAVPVVYGSRKIGATRVYLEVSGTDNACLHQVLVISEGEINAINTVYLNDVDSTDSRFNDLVTIVKKTGTDGQAAVTSSEMPGLPTAWTSAHKLSGFAYVYLKMKWDQDVFPRGAPTITFDIDGKKTHDPRTGTATFNNNPALAIRDYLTNTRYGRSIPTSQIDDAAIIAAANYSDAMVTKGGVLSARYTCDGLVDTTETSLDILNKLLSSCRGFLVFTAGVYKLVLDKPESAVFTFSEDNIVGSWSIVLGNKATTFNRITAKFFNPERNWQLDQAVIDSPTLRTNNDSGLMLERQTVLPFTSNIYTAKQIATINLNQSRQAVSCSFTATIEALRVEVGDVVYIKHDTPGWTDLNTGQGKLFRVMSMSLQSDDEVAITCREYDSTAYDFGTISLVDSTPDTNLPNPYISAAPNPTGVREELYTTVNSKGTQTRAFFNWSAPIDAYIKEYKAEYKLSSSPAYTFITTTSSIEARIDDIAAGQYDFRVRAINTLDVHSSWSYLYNKTISGLTAVPGDINNFTIRALDGQCHLTWSRITDLDVINGGYVRIRHSNLSTNATWEDGQDIGEAIAGSQTATVLPLLAGTYMAKAVDEGGRFSTNAKYAVTTVPNIIAFNAVLTATENPEFTGFKTNIILVDGILKLTGTPRFILSEDSDFLIAENGDRLSREIADAGVIISNGAYYFANSVDLGQTYTSRLTANLRYSVAVAADLVDYRIANIDTWQNFDGPSSDAISAVLELRTTNNDPESNPTWTDWEPFLVGDYHARAYEFRLIVTNTDSDYNINITSLAVNVDMPDRVEKASDLSVSANSTAVSFGSNFKAVPVIGVTMNDSNSGDYFRVTSKARTGFTVHCFNSSNIGIARSINWQAIGYGKEAD